MGTAERRNISVLVKVQIVLEDLAPPVVLRVVMANAQCLEIIPIQCNLRVVY